MQVAKSIFVFWVLAITTGCQGHLTGTALDLTPFGAILSAVGFLYWMLALGALILALTTPKTISRKAIATSVALAVFGYLPVKIGLQNRTDQNNLKDSMADFLDVCDRGSGETVLSRPLSVNHLYVYDSTENVTGAWGFTIFDEYKINKTDGDVSIVDDVNKVIPRVGNFLLKRSVIEQKTNGNFTYRGGRQELIDTSTGEVKAARTNYYLGNDFARGVSCLDSNWSAGFRSFVVRSIGFNPGFLRSDSWVSEIPRLSVRAELRSRNAADEAGFKAPILPPKSEYRYNDRQIVIDGVAHYLRQTFNNEPLKIVGVQSFPERMLISYETNAGAPSVLFQIRNKHSAQLLQEIYVKIPISLHQDLKQSINLHPWRIAKEGVSFANKRIRFDVVQMEDANNSKGGQYFRYSLEAPWDTEDIERSDLPAYLDDGHYGKFALQKDKVGGPLSDQSVSGQWISEPAGALWEFKDDHTIILYGSKWIWRIADGVLSAEYDHPNRDRASFRASPDGKVLEVTLSNRVGTYEPFVIRRVKASN